MQHFTPLDALFLHRDAPHSPRHIASLAILEPGDVPLGYDRLVKVITERIDLVPRYRQMPRWLPGGVGLPWWVDDPHFDIFLHVRRSALPRSGTREALYDLVSRLIARRLDRDRPLWELYLIEGLENDQTAMLFKSHQALVDGSHTVDLAQVLLEETARDREIPHDDWTPDPDPGFLGFLTESLRSHVQHPSTMLAAGEFQVERIASKLSSIRGDATGATGALAAPLSRNRRFTAVHVSLDDLRRVRAAHDGAVNDVILAAIAGGLRSWMLTRAEPVSANTGVRAMVPMSIERDSPDAESIPTSLGPRVRGMLVNLPVGEPNAVVRLHQVSYALRGHRQTGSAVAANDLASLPGFATSTFHAVGARVAEDEANRGYQIVITNVPGPQDPVFMAGQRLAEVYPAIPLSGRRPVSIAVTSYDGHVYFGIVADGEAVADVDVLGQCIIEAVDELVDTVSSRHTRAPRGRTRPKR